MDKFNFEYNNYLKLQKKKKMARGEEEERLKQGSKTNHKASFSNLGITQEANLQSNQIRIRITITRHRYRVPRSKIALDRRRRWNTPTIRAGLRQLMISNSLTKTALENFVPKESKVAPEDRNASENSTFEVDVKHFPAKLSHVEDGLKDLSLYWP